MLEIKFELNSKSVKNAIKQIEELQKKLPKINEEFVIESLEYVKNKANNKLRASSQYMGTTDITEKWEINKLLSTSKKIVSYELRNTSDFSAVVEFGTGIVGGNSPHPMASVSGYEYGTKQWSFVRDLTSNEWVVHNKFSKEEINENPDRFLVMRNFSGYEGKSYLYDSFWEYFYNLEYLQVYKNIINKYLV